MRYEGYEYQDRRPLPVKTKENGKTELDKFPGLTKRELDEVNDFYKPYLFYESTKAGRKFWSSCCHKKGKELKYIQRTQTGEEYAALMAKHNDFVSCPFCGREVQVKSIGTCGKCSTLVQFVPVVFLHTTPSGKTVYAQCYWTRKAYKDCWDEYPKYMVTYVARFRAGEAAFWEKPGWYGDKWTKKVNTFCTEPFRQSGLFSSYELYKVVGMEQLARSFLRYTQYDKYCLETDRSKYAGFRRYELLSGYDTLMRFLSLAAQHPAQVEMMMKAGMAEPIDDWINRRKKNTALIKWDEADPRKAFGLNGAELREFMASGAKMGTLWAYKKLKRLGETRATMEDAAAIGGAQPKKEFFDSKEFFKLCERHSLRPLRVVGYLRRFMEESEKRESAGGVRVRASFGWSFDLWKDYLTAAEQMGYELYRDNAVMPRDLAEAHETATEANRRRLDKERREKECAEEESRRLGYAPIYKRLVKKYEFEADGLRIVVPESESDIVAEGEKLHHCVGGYAQRHAEGKCTILFLRKSSAANMPFLTVQMNGDKLVQIHGWKNEGVYTTQGRFAPDPSKVYKDWLDTWLLWLGKGSRRDKSGAPILPKKQKKAGKAA